jgi:hypothetical protein
MFKKEDFSNFLLGELRLSPPLNSLPILVSMINSKTGSREENKTKFSSFVLLIAEITNDKKLCIYKR